jgi:O-methyltransferase domain
MWKSMGEFQYSLETGKTAAEKVFGMPVFDYLAQNPADAAQFSEAMVGIHGAEPPAVAEAYDFSNFGTIVDVGGATGNMLAHILGRYPQPKGILFDRPHVVTEAAALLRARGVENRVSIERGNFFRAYRQEVMRISCRTSSTTGTKISAAQFSGIAGRP